jgi:crotonobetainyl-CoA:carnitine CoA-transferase CaiB-like acyl-CoA transferase
VHTWEHPLAGSVNLVASPLKMSATPVRTDTPPPLLGQHTGEVLRELLGADAARIASLAERKVI